MKNEFEHYYGADKVSSKSKVVWDSSKQLDADLKSSEVTNSFLVYTKVKELLKEIDYSYGPNKAFVLTKKAKFLVRVYGMHKEVLLAKLEEEWESDGRVSSDLIKMVSDFSRAYLSDYEGLKFCSRKRKPNVY